MKLNRKSVILKVKKTLNLKATMSPKNSTDMLTWKTSNKKIAKVDQFGKVTAVKKGRAVITVRTSSGKKATCKVTVKK
ncbi:Ig-like domain-containing protein [Lachnospiraceae bacterium 66-29]